MEKEIKITPPEGYEIDKENSTFDCIKFKPVAKRWRDKEKAGFSGYFIAANSAIIPTFQKLNNDINYNVFATEKQAKSALAMARISQIMANDERFGGPITDEEWNNSRIGVYSIERFGNMYKGEMRNTLYTFLAFHTPKQRDLFLEENEDLVKDYLMID